MKNRRQRIQVMQTKDLSTAEKGGEGLNFETMLRECLACGIVSVDAKGKILALTPDARRLLRLSGGPRQARSLAQLPAAVRSVILEARKSNQVLADRLAVLRSKSKDPSSLSVTAMPVGKQPGTVIAMLRDVTPAAKLEQKLRRLDRLAGVGTLSA